MRFVELKDECQRTTLKYLSFIFSSRLLIALPVLMLNIFLDELNVVLAIHAFKMKFVWTSHVVVTLN